MGGAISGLFGGTSSAKAARQSAVANANAKAAAASIPVPAPPPNAIPPTLANAAVQSAGANQRARAAAAAGGPGVGGGFAGSVGGGDLVAPAATRSLLGKTTADA